MNKWIILNTIIADKGSKEYFSFTMYYLPEDCIKYMKLLNKPSVGSMEIYMREHYRYYTEKNDRYPQPPKLVYHCRNFKYDYKEYLGISYQNMPEKFNAYLETVTKEDAKDEIFENLELIYRECESLFMEHLNKRRSEVKKMEIEDIVANDDEYYWNVKYDKTTMGWNLCYLPKSIKKINGDAKRLFQNVYMPIFDNGSNYKIFTKENIEIILKDKKRSDFKDEYSLIDYIHKTLRI